MKKYANMLVYGAKVEEAVLHLKEVGYSMAQSAAILIKLNVGDSYVVGKIVNESPAWRS